MNSGQNFTGLKRFFSGLALFAVSASTVAFVTDPYLMADMALIILSMYLMVTGFSTRNV